MKANIVSLRMVWGGAPRLLTPLVVYTQAQNPECRRYSMGKLTAGVPTGEAVFCTLLKCRGQYMVRGQ